MDKALMAAAGAHSDVAPQKQHFSGAGLGLEPDPAGEPGELCMATPRVSCCPSLGSLLWKGTFPRIISKFPLSSSLAGAVDCQQN